MNTHASAERSYLIRAAICAAFYLALTFGAKIAIHEFSPHGAALALMAVTPAIAIIAYFYLFARHLMEVDEYQRHRMVQALLIATGIMLSVSSVMDFLQAYGAQPPLEPFVFTIGYMIVFTLVQGALVLRDKGGRS